MLNSSTLVSEFLKFSDSTYSDFIAYPSGTEDAVNKWGAMLEEYAKTIIPASTSSSLAKNNFVSAMNGVSSDSANWIPLFTTAISQFATTIGGGMSGFTPIPPQVPINLAPVLAVGQSGGSASEVANILATTIDTWFRTGTATPPGGSPVLWS